MYAVTGIQWQIFWVRGLSPPLDAYGGGNVSFTVARFLVALLLTEKVPKRVIRRVTSGPKSNH